MSMDNDLVDGLMRVCPEDAGTKEVYDTHWEAANRHAVAELLKNPPDVSTWPEVSRHQERAYQFVKQARRIRNEYLAKVTA
jgi:hypothetical protein